MNTMLHDRKKQTVVTAASTPKGGKMTRRKITFATNKYSSEKERRNMNYVWHSLAPHQQPLPLLPFQKQK